MLFVILMFENSNMSKYGNFVIGMLTGNKNVGKILYQISNGGTNMKASDILRRAAEIVEKDLEGGCYAIDYAFGEYPHYEVKVRAQKYFRSLFKNDETYWFGRPFPLFCDEGHRYHTENNKHRVLALLLTADIAESVGD